jgi:glycine cleavage system H lipoate-binding protein
MMPTVGITHFAQKELGISFEVETLDQTLEKMRFLQLRGSKTVSDLFLPLAEKL